MKKTLIALAALGAMAGAAQAQSAVTLYGVADAYLSSAKNTVVAPNAAGTGFTTSRLTQNGVSSGGQNGSRWGLKGTEDLGGGLKAVFQLESGFNIDTGTSAQGGALFGRQAFVGLSGGFGTVSLGRQYSAYDDVKGSVSAQGNNSFDVALGNVSALTAAGITTLSAVTTPANAAAQAAVLNSLTAGPGAWVGYTNARYNNSIKYQSNSYGGFSGAVVYGFNENKTATTSATKNVSANLKYANGPITAVVSHQVDEIASGFKLKNTLLGGAYDFGVAKVFGELNRAKFTDVAKQKEFALGVAVPVGAFTLVGQVARSKGDDLGKSTGYGLEAWYDLSKRTRFYTSFASAKKELQNDERNSLFGVGMRHSF